MITKHKKCLMTPIHLVLRNNYGAKGVRDVAPFIISHEQTQ